mmetsp:Transcript_17991/g.26965  ORF Transcript_17991/g.26965 Transcript_17991/m.26965 type:complete len:221 (-) Transcript_17991:1584-2246(-)
MAKMSPISTHNFALNSSEPILFSLLNRNSFILFRFSRSPFFHFVAPPYPTRPSFGDFNLFETAIESSSLSSLPTSNTAIRIEGPGVKTELNEAFGDADLNVSGRILLDGGCAVRINGTVGDFSNFFSSVGVISILLTVSIKSFFKSFLFVCSFFFGRCISSVTCVSESGDSVWYSSINSSSGAIEVREDLAARMEETEVVTFVSWLLGSEGSDTLLECER